MPTPVDLDRWLRRDTYEFFRDYEQPFFTVTAPVDVTAVYSSSRSPDPVGFFLRAAHAALDVVQTIPELRYRLREGTVVEHETIHLGATVLRKDETFAFCFVDYHPDLVTFAEGARPRIEDARSRRSWPVEDPERDDVVYLTSLPWIAFTSFEHAVRQPGDCIPRLVFGRHQSSGERRTMPVSVSVHHALTDGIHAGRFLERLEAATSGGRFDAPASR